MERKNGNYPCDKAELAVIQARANAMPSPLGSAPSLDEMGAVSNHMRLAGAAIIENFKDSFGTEQLAAAVYIAMVKQQLTEDG